jgi:hypothetical protein
MSASGANVSRIPEAREAVQWAVRDGRYFFDLQKIN